MTAFTSTEQPGIAMSPELRAFIDRVIVPALPLQINRGDIEQMCNLEPGTLSPQREPEEFHPTLKNK